MANTSRIGDAKQIRDFNAPYYSIAKDGWSALPVIPSDRAQLIVVDKQGTTFHEIWESTFIAYINPSHSIATRIY